MKKVGLALGVGGWKGFAHVGVIKTLEKHNIPIDYIAGSSIGALVGGLYAFYGNTQKLEEFFLKLGYKDLLKTVSDPHLKTGILKGEGAVKYLKTLTGDKNVEDLDISFCAVATDLVTGETVYIRRGSLAEAIRASGSVPILFDPACRGEKRLIDGGSTEPVPVRAVREMGADFVIAVNLNTNFFPTKKEDLLYKTKIALITSRAMIDKLAEYNCREADILIEPKISRQKLGVNLSLEWFLKFIREKDIIKDGIEATEKEIPKIKKLLESNI